jgi:HEAT repeat protein
MMGFRALCWVGLCLSFCGCAGSAAATRVSSDVARGDFGAALAGYEQDGRRPLVLRALSEGLLLRAARATDPAERRAGFIELSMLGTRAQELLEQLSQDSEPAYVRAEALRLRCRLGNGADRSARAALRALLNDADPEVSDSAIQALEPGSDAALLEAALRSPRSTRRSTALAMLGRAAPEYLSLLIEVSRFDPKPQLRAAALHALESYGAQASEAFEQATRDPDPLVRVAALTGFARVAPERAEPILDQQLGAAASTDSIAAATALLSLEPALAKNTWNPGTRARALSALFAALSSADPALRVQAAAALQRLPTSQIDRGSLQARLRTEKVESVRLALALILGSEDPASRRALTDLSASFNLTGADAAAELAAQNSQARERLIAFSTHASALVRATAARLIARTLRDPAVIAKLLADQSWQVRDAAAGAVLNVM